MPVEISAYKDAEMGRDVQVATLLAVHRTLSFLQQNPAYHTQTLGRIARMVDDALTEVLNTFGPAHDEQVPEIEENHDGD